MVDICPTAIDSSSARLYAAVQVPDSGAGGEKFTGFGRFAGWPLGQAGQMSEVGQAGQASQPGQAAILTSVAWLAWPARLAWPAWPAWTAWRLGKLGLAVLLGPPAWPA